MAHVFENMPHDHHVEIPGRIPGLCEFHSDADLSPRIGEFRGSLRQFKAVNLEAPVRKGR